MGGAYRWILVRSFRPASTAGKHGDVHIQALEGQGPIFRPDLGVSCSKLMMDSSRYKVPTVFKIKAQRLVPKVKADYLYANPRDPVITMTPKKVAEFFANLKRGGSA